MRAYEKASALRVLLNASDNFRSYRSQIAALGDVVGPTRAKDLDALTLKLSSVLTEAFLEVAKAAEDPEPRTPEQEAADARAEAAKGEP